MNKRNILHRDIKPENLILRSKESEYDIVIVDFGLSIDLSAKYQVHSRCGTPGYCAPEILNARSGKPEIFNKCDVFSLGCVFYHM
jgi:serine/threonine protein kinase